LRGAADHRGRAALKTTQQHEKQREEDMPEFTEATVEKNTVKIAEAELVEVLGGDGGTTPVSARLICNPAGTSDYYSDSRDAEGKLVIGAKLKDYAD
jgi:hypothetical protein